MQESFQHYQFSVFAIMTEDQSYLIHDNGGRPFKVVISDTKVKVYRQATESDEVPYDKLIHTISNPIKTFVGEDTHKQHYTGTDSKGNSILVHVKGKKYVSIEGFGIYSFESEHEITKYVADIGPNDVPYVYAMDNKFIYLLTDQVYFEQAEYGPYSVYYGHKPTTTRPLRNIVKIQNRLWS